MEMKNTFVGLEQFAELTPEVLEEVNGGGIFEDIYNWLRLRPEPRSCFVPNVLTK